MGQEWLFAGFNIEYQHFTKGSFLAPLPPP